MSLSERLAAARNPERFNPYANTSSVAADGMRLAEKRSRLEPASEQIIDEPETVEATADTDALFGDIDVTDSSPMFEQMVNEYTETGVEVSADPSTTVEQSSSRLAELLRSGANGVEVTAEKWDDTKDRAKKRLGLIGRAALRIAGAGRELAVGVRVVAAEKALNVADRADDALFNAVDSAKESVKSTAINTGLRAENMVKAGMTKVEAGLDKTGNKMISLQEGAKDRLLGLKNASLARKQARHAKWAARYNGAKQSVENGKQYVGNKVTNAQESVADKAEKVRRSQRTLRAIGRASIDSRSAL